MRSSFSTILLLYHVLSIWNFLILTCTIYILAPGKHLPVPKSLPSRECGLKSLPLFFVLFVNNVTPLAGVWIEICGSLCLCDYYKVTPLAGVWIEMILNLQITMNCIVTPLAGVWIEMILNLQITMNCIVTPLAGVWIEIPFNDIPPTIPSVTPLAGVWIEILIGCPAASNGPSLPSRECGLKSFRFYLRLPLPSGHSPRGSVD